MAGHPEIALHPIHGPDGATALPVGHPQYRDGDEKLPAAWDAEFVAEMVAGGYAGKPTSKAAKQKQTSDAREESTSVTMNRPRRTA